MVAVKLIISAYHFFLVGFCVNAEPAAVFEVLLVLAFRSVFEAAVAALAEVTLGGALVCDSADPAADFAVLLVEGFLNTFEAAEAAFFPVTSLILTIANLLYVVP
jgi:hypothetical protein